jgi:hypothetical protein
MKVWSSLLVLLALGFTLAPNAAAQEGEEEEVRANSLVMRYFECGLGNTSRAVELLNGQWRDVMDELEDEGMIQGFGILTHGWGDEWNVMDWIAVENAHAFHTAWSEAVSRMGVRDPDGNMFREFVKLCPRHKDNMWGIVHEPEDEDEAEDG